MIVFPRRASPISLPELFLERARVFAIANPQVAAHAGGEIDDEVFVLLANALHHFAVEVRAAAALARDGVAYVDVGHGSASSGGLERRVGDLLGSDRDGRVFADRVASSGDGASDDDFLLHGIPSR